MIKILFCIAFLITVISGDEGLCSHYGAHGFEGTKTSCGVIFHMNEITAASNKYPCGTILHVHVPLTGKTISVKVTNTGGFAPGVILDLSEGAALALDIHNEKNGMPHCIVTKA